MQPGEKILHDLERWEKRGSIRAVPLPGGVRRVRPEDLRTLRPGVFTGFAPLCGNGTVVRVKRVRPIE